MTPEELQAELDDQKAQNLLMKNKNKELLDEMKAVKRKNSEVDIEAYHKALDRVDVLESENAKLTGDSKLSKKEFDKLTEALGEKDKSIHKLLVSDGITKELASLGVEDIDTLMPYFERNATVENGVALLNGKTIKESMTEWADGAGKRYIPASQNSGGGANGGGTSTTPSLKRSEMNHSEKAAYISANGQDAYLKLS